MIHKWFLQHGSPFSSQHLQNTDLECCVELWPRLWCSIYSFITDFPFHNNSSKRQTSCVAGRQHCDTQNICPWTRTSVFITTVSTLWCPIYSFLMLKNLCFYHNSFNTVMPNLFFPHAHKPLFLSQQFQNTDLRCVGWPALTLGSSLPIYLSLQRPIYLKRLLQPSFCQRHMSTFEKRNIYAANSNVRKLNFLIHHVYIDPTHLFKFQTSHVTFKCLPPISSSISWSFASPQVSSPAFLNLNPNLLQRLWPCRRWWTPWT